MYSIVSYQNVTVVYQNMPTLVKTYSKIWLSEFEITLPSKAGLVTTGRTNRQFGRKVVPLEVCQFLGENAKKVAVVSVALKLDFWSTLQWHFLAFGGPMEEIPA